MLRAIVALLFGWIIWTFWKKLMLRQSSRQKAPESPKKISGEMIACKKCGTFVLLSESLSENGDKYCSSECLNGLK